MHLCIFALSSVQRGYCCNTMAKSKDTKKEKKKEPAKSLKEKRADKQAKRDNKSRD